MPQELPAVHPLRAINRVRVLKALMDNAVRSRPELARQLGLSLTAITRLTNELIEAGLVEEGEKYAAIKPGRPSTELNIDASGAYVLGIELHAFQQSVVLMDLSRRIVRRKILQLSRPDDGPGSISEVAQQAKREIRAAKIDPLRVVGVGVAVTGIVNRERGILIDAPYLGWSSLNIAAQLEKYLEAPVVVDRIANALLTAEAHYGADSVRDAFLFNVGFGMSASFLIEGNIARGANAMAGHSGHVASDDTRRTCACGQKGCLNAVASGWAALAELGEIKDEVASAEEFQRYRGKLAELLDRERNSEPKACGALRQVGQTLGRTMRRFHIALDPARMFLSGPVGRAASFIAGARSGVGDDLAGSIFCCEHQVADAAALMAIDEFVRSARMDFARLHLASRNSPRIA